MAAPGGQRVALVFGGTGNIGFAAVAAFLRHGYTVVAPGRQQSSVDRLVDTLKKHHVPTDSLATWAGDVSSPAGAEALLRDVVEARFGRLDHVVSSSGPWLHAPPLHECSFEQWRQGMHSNYEAHVVFWTTFYKALQRLHKVPSPSYTIVTGAAGDDPGFVTMGLTGLLAHNLCGFARTVMHQTQDLQPVRANQLHIHIRVENPEQVDRTRIGERYTDSLQFGPVFVALAEGTQKGEIVDIKSMAQVKQLLDQSVNPSQGI